MIEGDFVQFYEPRKNVYLTSSFYYVCNGFGYISDQVKENWIDLRLFKEYIPRHKKVYVSTWYGFHQDVCLYWARKFPKNDFLKN